MSEIRFSVPFDTATVSLTDLQARLHPHTIATRIAVPLAKHWKSHLSSLPKNKHGYPSSLFWESAARSVTGVAVGGSAVVTADKLGLKQRYYGGPITARNVKNITIPICAEAYGTSVADWGFENLVLVITPNGFKFLALWLGYDEARAAYKANLGKKLTKRAETTAARVNALRAALPGSAKKPNIIVLRGKGGGLGGYNAKNTMAMALARASRHMNLKFLFLLLPSVEQAGNPLIIPSDMQEFALQQVREAAIS